MVGRMAQITAAAFLQLVVNFSHMEKPERFRSGVKRRTLG